MPRTRAAGSPVCALVGVTLALSFFNVAHAQCTPGWQPANASSNMDGLIRWLKMWDPDGSGPQAPVLVAGGDFNNAGAASASHVATWDGSGWSALDVGVNGPVYCIASLDSNNHLYVVGASF